MALPIDSQIINLLPSDILFLSLRRFLIKDLMSGISEVFSLLKLSGKLYLFIISCVFNSKFSEPSLLNNKCEIFEAIDIPSEIASPCFNFSLWDNIKSYNILKSILFILLTPIINPLADNPEYSVF